MDIPCLRRYRGHRQQDGGNGPPGQSAGVTDMRAANPSKALLLGLAGVLAVTSLAGCSSVTTTGSDSTGSDSTGSDSTGASSAGASSTRASTATAASASGGPGAAATVEPVLSDGEAALRLTLDGCDDCIVTLKSTASGKVDWASDPIAMAQAEGPVWVKMPKEYTDGLTVLVTTPAAPGTWAAVLNYDNAAVASKPNPGAFSSYKHGFACTSGELTDDKGTLSLAAQVVAGPALAVYSLQALPADGPEYPVTNGALRVEGDFLSCRV
jgi:hypothetical protein